jgi:peptidyl-prolyl cis-trans isomerase C
MFMKNTSTSLALLLVAAALAAPRAPAASPAPTKAAAPTNTAAPARPALKTTDLFPDTVVAKGKGVEVKRSQLDEDVSRFKTQYASRGQAIPPDQMPEVQRHLLDEIIRTQLLQAKATDADKLEAKNQVEKRLAEVKTELGSEEALNLRLKAQDTTREKLLAEWTETMTAQLVLERDLKLSVADADVKKFYDDNPSQFEQAEQVRASHILISTKDPTDLNPNNPMLQKDLSPEQKAAKRKVAEDLLKRARAGEDFAKLAKQYSDDPGSKDTGGEYKFPRGKMMPEFEAAAFALKTNEVSDIVQTSYGYHIIKLSEKIPAQKVELAKVAPQVREYLRRQQMRNHEQEIEDYFTKLEKDANVQILDESLKPKEAALTPLLPPGHPAVPEPAKKAATEPAKKAPAK